MLGTPLGKLVAALGVAVVLGGVLLFIMWPR